MDFTYLKQLAGAGLDGIVSARHELPGGVFSPMSASAVWTPAAIGAAAGMLSARLVGRRASRYSLAMGGLVGSAVGLAAAAAWASRQFTGTAARRALPLLNAARDAHWLQKHPINYA